ncbi:MAG: hypothetical protein WCL44_09200 [bacterium]
MVRDLVRLYYAQIRSLLRERPDLRPYLKHCRHCRILFFTDPRNAGRSDLYCGFGCREAHRRQSSTRRSAAFYREHPNKKRDQNRKRYLRTCPQLGRRAASPGRDGCAAAKCEPATPIIRYVRVIVSLIEGRPVTLDEIVKMLAKKGRQHRMARKRRSAYVARRIEGRGS